MGIFPKSKKILAPDPDLYYLLYEQSPAGMACVDKNLCDYIIFTFGTVGGFHLRRSSFCRLSRRTFRRFGTGVVCQYEHHYQQHKEQKYRHRKQNYNFLHFVLPRSFVCLGRATARVTPTQRSVEPDDREGRPYITQQVFVLHLALFSLV
jgi:hypothetical protein